MKKAMRYGLKATNWGVLLATGAWLGHNPGWDSLAAALVSLAGVIALEEVPSSEEESRLAADRTLFEQFLKVMPSNGSVHFVDQQNMAGWSFDSSRLRDLETFYYDWKDAEHEFHNANVERLRVALHKAVERYLQSTVGKLFPAQKPGWVSVPEEWDEEQPDRFNEAVDELHRLAGELVKAHQDFVREARKRLGV